MMLKHGIKQTTESDGFEPMTSRTYRWNAMDVSDNLTVGLSR